MIGFRKEVAYRMKKINIAIIATILIAIHVFLFLHLTKGEKKAPPTRTCPVRPSISESIPSTTPRTASPVGFEVPQIIAPLPEPKKEEQDTPPSGSLKQIEKIAIPGTKEGFLRRDLPVRRTTKAYSKLVETPYRGAIVLDAHTGRILYESGAFKYAYPASVTKLMTLLLVLEELEKGKIHLTDSIRITPEVSKIGGSQIWLDPRESMTVDDLLYAMIVHSANDAAYALALYVAGSREAFVQRMNAKARELGMSSTIYHSPHGLPPKKGKQPDISTPYDIAILSMAVLRHPDALRYTSTELKYIRNGKTMLATRNALAKRVDGYLGCDGLKTGFHQMGGWSIAITARHHGDRVLAVVLGAPNKKIRNDQARKLLDRGFAEIEKDEKK